MSSSLLRTIYPEVDEDENTVDDNFSPDSIALFLSKVWALHKTEDFVAYLTEIFGKSIPGQASFDCIYISQAEEGDIPNAILRSAARWWQVDDSGFKNIGRPDMSKPDALRSVRSGHYTTPMIRFFNEGNDILIGENYGPQLLSRKVGLLEMVNEQIVLTGIRVVKTL